MSDHRYHAHNGALLCDALTAAQEALADAHESLCDVWSRFAESDGIVPFHAAIAFCPCPTAKAYRAAHATLKEDARNLTMRCERCHDLGFKCDSCLSAARVTAASASQKAQRLVALDLAQRVLRLVLQDIATESGYGLVANQRALAALALIKEV